MQKCSCPYALILYKSWFDLSIPNFIFFDFLYIFCPFYPHFLLEICGKWGFLFSFGFIYFYAVLGFVLHIHPNIDLFIYQNMNNIYNVHTHKCHICIYVCGRKYIDTCAKNIFFIFFIFKKISQIFLKGFVNRSGEMLNWLETGFLAIAPWFDTGVSWILAGAPWFLTS